jgi:LPXTG-motif cell wall-anchored protein
MLINLDDEFDQLYAKKIDGKKKDQPSSSVTTEATIAIIVAAVLGGLLLICIIGFVFWRKKKKSDWIKAPVAMNPWRTQKLLPLIML